MQIEIERVNDKVHLEAKNEQGVVVQMDGSPEIGGEDLRRASNAIGINGARWLHINGYVINVEKNA
jgi:hypothetical protein